MVGIDLGWQEGSDEGRFDGGLICFIEGDIKG
jgi:hypothetical protein